MLYILFTLPPIQSRLSTLVSRQLSELLQTPVDVGEVNIAPFNRLAIREVKIHGNDGDDILSIDRMGAGLSIGSLLHGEIVVTYSELIGLKLNLERSTPDAPLNIQPIIDRFKPAGEKKAPLRFDLAINMIVIRRAEINYDVISEPYAVGRFDRNHISVTDLKGDIKFPRLSNDHISVDINRISAAEKSGLKINNLKGLLQLTPTQASLMGFTIQLPKSEILVGDLTVNYASLNTFGNDLSSVSVSASVLPASFITVSDLEPIVPKFRSIDSKANIDIDISGTLDSLSLNRFDITAYDSDLWFRTQGEVLGLVGGIDGLDLRFKPLSLSIPSDNATEILENLAPVSPQVKQIISRLNHLDLVGALNYSAKEWRFKGFFSTQHADLDMTMSYKPSTRHLGGQVSLTNCNPSAIDMRLSGVSGLQLTSTVDLSLAPDIALWNGNANLTVNELIVNDHNLAPISFEAECRKGEISAQLASDNPLNQLSVDALVDMASTLPRLRADVDIKRFSAVPYVAGSDFDSLQVALKLQTSLSGNSLDNLLGSLVLSNLKAELPRCRYSLDSLKVDSRFNGQTKVISLRSDIADARLRGRFCVDSVKGVFSEIIAGIYPSITNSTHTATAVTGDYDPNQGVDMDLNITLKPDTMLNQFLKLPLTIVHPVNISASLNQSERYASVSLDAQYIQNKNKLIENTVLRAELLGAKNKSKIFAKTTYPTKKGAVEMTLVSDGSLDRSDTEINWSNHKSNYGNLKFATTFSRPDGQRLATRTRIHQSQLSVNDSVWTVKPATVSTHDGKIEINDVNVAKSDKQYLTIDGTVSADSTDLLRLRLCDIDLDYVFATLAINNVTFGGMATGDFDARSLLTSTPIINTQGLRVKDFKYNYAVLGDALIKSQWQPDTKSILIDADISQANGMSTFVNGYICPNPGGLDLEFKANGTNAALMQPFMAAFASEVTGRIFGRARLFGSFKDINLEGEMAAKDLRMLLSYTNCMYTASDSVHIRPGRIELKDITLSDKYGNKARLNGLLTHDFFRNATYDFKITDARDLLCYDVAENDENPWYGKVFGNGSASITGEPGLVTVGVDMSTASKSNFTFVLSDNENAADYNFLTFTDKTSAKKDSIAQADLTQILLQRLQNQAKKAIAASPSIFKMNLNIGINPQSTMNLIMDPVGGDKIVANGSGQLKLAYASDSDFKMYGKYVLSKGLYKFTLQDIILKDFTIREGSGIEFFGSPYDAQLDIEALYSLNANIADLDESFLQDRDLNRTSVKVQAVVNISGALQQPELKFGLDFPTLTDEAKRKINSIISTDDMMNRQIIYLLALNRFYTPEYMSASRGNEFVSVASSTVSSKLSSILGQLSDKWTIAPQFRSDKGDFSDVEVDLALSSTLLNNRLLLNGNLGYRDKALNNNSFIGDFDAEYLLNKSGTMSLKAYNRYNDQNYYLKSALTTQGVGIMLKRDFDNFFSFLRPLNIFKRNKETTDTTSTDNSSK